MTEWAAFANLTFIENISGQAHYVTVQQNFSLGGGFSSAVGRDQNAIGTAAIPNAYSWMEFYLASQQHRRRREPGRAQHHFG